MARQDRSGADSWFEALLPFLPTHYILPVAWVGVSGACVLLGNGLIWLYDKGVPVWAITSASIALAFGAVRLLLHRRAPVTLGRLTKDESRLASNGERFRFKDR